MCVHVTLQKSQTTVKTFTFKNNTLTNHFLKPATSDQLMHVVMCLMFSLSISTVFGTDAGVCLQKNITRDITTAPDAASLDTSKYNATDCICCIVFMPHEVSDDRRECYGDISIKVSQ